MSTYTQILYQIVFGTKEYGIEFNRVFDNEPLRGFLYFANPERIKHK